MTKNRFIIAFQKTLLLFATLHLLILAVEAFRSGNFIYFHMGNILDLQLLFPRLQYTPLLGALLMIPVLIVFVYHYSRIKENNLTTEKLYRKK